MSRTRLALGLSIAVATSAPAATQAAPAAVMPKLVGTVGPGYTITLTENGKKVTRLKSGTYSLTIHDEASIHSWSLDGPKGYAKDFTTVPFTGTKTFTVKLVKGKYKYYCPPHEPVMFGRLTVS